MSQTDVDVLNNNMQAMIEEAKVYAGGQSLWDELMDEEEKDTSWFEKFGDKAKGVKTEILEKMKDVKVHFTKLIDEGGKDMENMFDTKKLAIKNKEGVAYKLSILTIIVRRAQNLVNDHGKALEFIRELFMKQEEKIEKIEKEVKAKPKIDDDYVKRVVMDVVEEKQKEYDEKLKSVMDDHNIIKKENVDIKKENDDLKLEVDEARQRGIKGNLLISCPPRNGVSAADARQRTSGENQRMETQMEVLLRLIQEKTGCQIQKSDVVACHPVSGKPGKASHTWVLRVGNMAPGSGWESLAACMMSGKYLGTQDYLNTNDGVFINYQLTATRGYLYRQVRLTRKMEKKIDKFSVNQNGEIRILKEKAPRNPQGVLLEKERWIKVDSMDHLQSLMPGVSYPLQESRQGQPRQQEPAGASRSLGRVSVGSRSQGSRSQGSRRHGRVSLGSRVVEGGEGPEGLRIIKIKYLS